MAKALLRKTRGNFVTMRNGGGAIHSIIGKIDNVQVAAANVLDVRNLETDVIGIKREYEHAFTTIYGNEHDTGRQDDLRGIDYEIEKDLDLLQELLFDRENVSAISKVCDRLVDRLEKFAAASSSTRNGRAGTIATDNDLKKIQSKSRFNSYNKYPQDYKWILQFGIGKQTFNVCILEDVSMLPAIQQGLEMLKADTGIISGVARLGIFRSSPKGGNIESGLYSIDLDTGETRGQGSYTAFDNVETIAYLQNGKKQPINRNGARQDKENELRAELAEINEQYSNVSSLKARGDLSEREANQQLTDLYYKRTAIEKKLLRYNRNGLGVYKASGKSFLELINDIEAAIKRGNKVESQTALMQFHAELDDENEENPEGTFARDYIYHDIFSYSLELQTAIHAKQFKDALEYLELLRQYLLQFPETTQTSSRNGLQQNGNGSIIEVYNQAVSGLTDNYNDLAAFVYGKSNDRYAAKRDIDRLMRAAITYKDAQMRAQVETLEAFVNSQQNGFARVRLNNLDNDTIIKTVAKLHDVIVYSVITTYEQNEKTFAILETSAGTAAYSFAPTSFSDTGFSAILLGTFNSLADAVERIEYAAANKKNNGNVIRINEPELLQEFAALRLAMQRQYMFETITAANNLEISLEELDKHNPRFDYAEQLKRVIQINDAQGYEAGVLALDGLRQDVTSALAISYRSNNGLSKHTRGKLLRNKKPNGNTSKEYEYLLGKKTRLQNELVELQSQLASEQGYLQQGHVNPKFTGNIKLLESDIRVCLRELEDVENYLSEGVSSMNGKKPNGKITPENLRNTLFIVGKIRQAVTNDDEIYKGIHTADLGYSLQNLHRQDSRFDFSEAYQNLTPFLYSTNKADALNALKEFETMLNSYQFNGVQSNGKKQPIKRAKKGAKKNSFVDDNDLIENFTSNELNQFSQEFQGYVSGEAVEMIASDYTPEDIARKGGLVEMILTDGTMIEFNPETSFAAADIRRNIHFVGEGAILEGLDYYPQDGLRELGKVQQMTYRTAKTHLNDGLLTDWFHDFGEVDGQQPTLFVDADGFPVFVGGNYTIKELGIEN